MERTRSDTALPESRENLQVKPVERLGYIRVGIPSPTTWFRINDRPDYRGQFLVLNLDGTYYLVAPHLRLEVLEHDIQRAEVYVGITREGGIFLWPIPFADFGTRFDDWPASALHATACAMKAWVRVIPRRELEQYVVLTSQSGNYPDPQWPSSTLHDLILRAFNGRIIDSVDHPIVRMLKGLL
jgi:hypothetical protein